MRKINSTKEVCAGMCVDMCIDMCIDMCMDMRIDLCARPTRPRVSMPLLNLVFGSHLCSHYAATVRPLCGHCAATVRPLCGRCGNCATTVQPL